MCIRSPVGEAAGQGRDTLSVRNHKILFPNGPWCLPRQSRATRAERPGRKELHAAAPRQPTRWPSSRSPPTPVAPPCGLRSQPVLQCVHRGRRLRVHRQRHCVLRRRLVRAHARRRHGAHAVHGFQPQRGPLQPSAEPALWLAPPASSRPPIPWSAHSKRASLGLESQVTAEQAQRLSGVP